MLRRVTEEQPARPRTLDRNIPLDLETIILKATAREPVHRYTSAAALADDLRAFLDDRPIRARRATPAERLSRWCRRNKWIAGMTAVATVSLLAAAIWGWVMYAAQTQATERSEANVKLSLEALNNLFDQLADRDEFGPVMAGLGPGPPPGDRPPTPGDRPPEPGPHGQLRNDLNEKDAALLQSILVFYDRFAEHNETNSRLQGEAARALRKVAALYRMLGRDEEADEALARATHRFESLTALYPNIPRYRFELARTYALDDQFPPESIEPDRIEQGIRKALPLVQRLDAESPDSEEYVMALARWKARLGLVLQQRNQLVEAEAYYRQSIAHDESLLGKFKDPAIVQMVLATNREVLAQIMMSSGRRDDAKELLDQATDGLIALRRNAPRRPRRGRAFRSAILPPGCVL